MRMSMLVPREVKVTVTYEEGNEEVIWQKVVNVKGRESLHWTWERPIEPNGGMCFGGQHVGFVSSEEILTIRYHHPMRDV